MNENISVISKILFDTKAVFLNTNDLFTWSSGIKSPIYCDNRVLISYPKERKIIAKMLSNLVLSSFPDVECIAATATGAIAHGAWVSDILNLPMLYVLSKNKTHGRQRNIEGAYSKGLKVVVLEDLVSTGGSSLNVVQTLKDSNLDVLGCVSIFNYGFDESKKYFLDSKVELKSLLNFSDLILYAKDNHLINEKELTFLEDWRKNPHKFI